MAHSPQNLPTLLDEQVLWKQECESDSFSPYNVMFINEILVNTSRKNVILLFSDEHCRGNILKIKIRFVNYDQPDVDSSIRPFNHLEPLDPPPIYRSSWFELSLGGYLEILIEHTTYDLCCRGIDIISSRTILDLFNDLEILKSTGTGIEVTNLNTFMDSFNSALNLFRELSNFDPSMSGWKQKVELDAEAIIHSCSKWLNSKVTIPTLEKLALSKVIQNEKSRLLGTDLLPPHVKDNIFLSYLPFTNVLGCKKYRRYRKLHSAVLTTSINDFMCGGDDFSVCYRNDALI